MIPFIFRIPDEQRILGFSDRLRDEWPGILAWMIEGAGRWRRLGLSPPPAVLAATQEYLDSEDTIGAWLEECTERVADGFESRKRLFASWKEFALRTGENPGTQKQLVGALAGRTGINPHMAMNAFRGTWGTSLHNRRMVCVRASFPYVGYRNKCPKCPDRDAGSLSPFDGRRCHCQAFGNWWYCRIKAKEGKKPTMCGPYKKGKQSGCLLDDQ